MLFNSLEFLIFLPIVFICYWFLFNKNIKVQNLLIIVASYFFYGWWDWRFLFLIFISSFSDYLLAIKLMDEQKERQRKIYLGISLMVNLGILGIFKYYNFFLSEFNNLIAQLGYQSSWSTLNIILPVGISFYTFQTMSYTIDVYRKKIAATRDATAFFAYVSFFPQLVAGPIERASHLLPQFLKERTFDFKLAKDGLRQILIGFFKKVVIADNCAVFADQIFNNYSDYNSISLILGAFFFSIQIYGDFSGYSDIAIGLAKLFGFKLKDNFLFPYFSRDIAEFWRRWHISLSSWFKDYLYIPLGGSRGSKLMNLRNIFAIFIVSGFWHGANWTFLFWGLLNALYFLPSFFLGSNRNNLGIVAQNSSLPSLTELYKITSTFVLAMLAWIFFRSPSIQDAFLFIYQILSNNGEKNLYNPYLFVKMLQLKWLFINIAILIILEWTNRRYNHGLKTMTNNIFLKYLIFIYMFNCIVHNFFNEQTFIYFQF